MHYFIDGWTNVKLKSAFLVFLVLTTVYAKSLEVKMY